MASNISLFDMDYQGILDNIASGVDNRRFLRICHYMLNYSSSYCSYHQYNTINLIFFNPLDKSLKYAEASLTLPYKYHRYDNKEELGLKDEPVSLRFCFNPVVVKPVTKMLINPVIVNIGDYTSYLKAANPYAYQFCREALPHMLMFNMYACCPAIEILWKAGYAFAQNFRAWGYSVPVDEFNRLVKADGTDPKSIFKCSKVVYSVLKNENRLSTWDIFRKMDKFGILSKDDMALLIDMHLAPKHIDRMRYILNFEHHGRKVFTLSSLVNYLNRIDQYEAIERLEGIEILYDYLHMCKVLDMEPKVDGDSLKREHDISARLCREVRNERLALAMEAASNNNADYNFESGSYLIRAIKDYDDLLDEAKQQHNCVASYADRIAKGTSRIFVMRRVDDPDKSLVTVELDPTASIIRQKYLAYNRPIHDKSMSDFLSLWLKHCKEINAANMEIIMANNESSDVSACIA